MLIGVRARQRAQATHRFAAAAAFVPSVDIVGPFAAAALEPPADGFVLHAARTPVAVMLIGVRARQRAQATHRFEPAPAVAGFLRGLFAMDVSAATAVNAVVKAAMYAAFPSVSSWNRPPYVSAPGSGGLRTSPMSGT